MKRVQIFLLSLAAVAILCSIVVLIRVRLRNAPIKQHQEPAARTAASNLEYSPTNKGGAQVVPPAPKYQTMASPGKHTRTRTQELAALAETVMAKRQEELAALRARKVPDAPPDPNVLAVVKGAYDPDTHVNLSGVIQTQAEALPTILEYLFGEDKQKLIKAVGALNYYGTSIGSTRIIDRLVELWHATPSPLRADYPFMPQDELDALNLKLGILLTLSSSGDERKDQILKEAEADHHKAVRGFVRKIKTGEPTVR